MSRYMPFILLSLIALAFALDPILPVGVKSACYALSLATKSAILFLLPFIIFSLLFTVTSKLAKEAGKLILIVLVAVCTSNFIATMASQPVGHWIYAHDISIAFPDTAAELVPLWVTPILKLIPNQVAMLLGIILGMFFGNLYPIAADHITLRLKAFSGILLQLITYMVPVFVVGYVIKLQHEGMVLILLKDYAFIFATVTLVQVIYILGFYVLAHKGRVSQALQSLKHILPAGLIGFTTMSSATAMPSLITALQKSSKKDGEFASSIIPATINVHMISDCITVPAFAYAILKTYGIMEPTLVQYLIFTFYFVLARFSVAGVPGGGILVMIPLLEAYLGFNGAMVSLITALYLLFDPLITCINVLGNGAFAIGMARLTRKGQQPEVMVS